MAKREPTKAAAGQDSAAAEAVEVIDGEVVEEDAADTPGMHDAEAAATPGTPKREAADSPGMPGSEAEDMPVDSEPEHSPDDGLDLTSPASGEGRGAPSQGRDEATATLQRERDEYLDLAQRTRADFENYRRRMAGEVAAAGVRARTELGSGLIGVIDNLEHALAAAGIDPVAALAGKTKAEGELEQGIALTYRELASVLARAGIEAYDPTGEAFDPTWHEALQTRAADGVEPGTIVDVLQKGYRIDQQVVRAARVVVSE